LAVILLALFTPTEFLGIAFDSGGVTTGPMTVPILLSLGIGICSTGAFRNELDGYGMIGLASIGPIIALLILGLVSGGDTSATAAMEAELYEEDTLDRLLHEFKDSLTSVAMAILPLMIFFAVFQKVFLRYSWNTVIHMVKGTTLAGVGIVIFLTAIYTGFIPVAADIGGKLYDHPFVLMILGALLGFLVAIAEPAVEILAGRVQKSSGGNITKKVVKYVISGGVAMFVAIGMLRLSYDFSLLWIVVPGYILAIILMWIGDKDMVGIAFDAGGVSTGPMSVAIISSMYTSIASVMYDGTDAVINGFGIIALIALAPILFLEAFSVYIKIMKVKDGRLILPLSSAVSTGTGTPSYLCRRIQHHQFDVQTQMFFTPRDSTEAAGLLIFKNEKHQYFLCRSEKGLELRQISGSDKCKVLAFSVLPDYVERVYLRAECRGTTYSFFYRLEGSGVDDWTVIAENVDASFVSSKVGGFTGTTIGVYAEKVNY
jgi:hypothetical protein